MILAYAAIALWLLGWALNQGVHALGHEAYVPSLVGRLFDDGTNVPPYLAGTFLVLSVVASRSFFGKAIAESKERLAIVASGLAACVGGGIGLWIAAVDLRHAPPDPWFGSAGLHAPLLMGVSGMHLLCGATLVLPSARRHFGTAMGLSAAVFTCLALLLAWVHAALGRLPSFAELPLLAHHHRVVVAVVVLLAIVVPATIVVASGRAWRCQAMAVVLAQAGLMAATLLAFSAQVGFGHMCMHRANASVQRSAELSLVAVAALGSLAIVGSREWLRRRQASAASDGRSIAE